MEQSHRHDPEETEINPNDEDGLSRIAERDRARSLADAERNRKEAAEYAEEFGDDE